MEQYPSAKITELHAYMTNFNNDINEMKDILTKINDWSNRGIDINSAINPLNTQIQNWEKTMNELLGKIHFWFSLIFMNGIFMPMFIQGLAGVSRRLADGGTTYAHAANVFHLNEFMSWSAWLLGLAQIPFIINLVMTLRKKKDESVDSNPWKATTIEWTDTTSPPLGHGNFETVPSVYRGPYEYSVPGEDEDFIPQSKNSNLKEDDISSLEIDEEIGEDLHK